MSIELSESIRLVLKDGDELWPSTVAGSYRLIVSKTDHNVLGEGERAVSEEVMIEGVLAKGLASRWRSKTNPKRKIANHFSLTSPSVERVLVNIKGVWVEWGAGA